MRVCERGEVRCWQGGKQENCWRTRLMSVELIVQDLRTVCGHHFREFMHVYHWTCLCVEVKKERYAQWGDGLRSTGQRPRRQPPDCGTTQAAAASLTPRRALAVETTVRRSTEPLSCGQTVRHTELSRIGTEVQSPQPCSQLEKMSCSSRIESTKFRPNMTNWLGRKISAPEHLSGL